MPHAAASNAPLHRPKPFHFKVPHGAWLFLAAAWVRQGGMGVARRRRSRPRRRGCRGRLPVSVGGSRRSAAVVRHVGHDSAQQRRCCVAALLPTACPGERDAAGAFLHEATSVAVDSHDEVHCFDRGNVPVVVFDSDGDCLRGWDNPTPHAGIRSATTGLASRVRAQCGAVWSFVPHLPPFFPSCTRFPAIPRLPLRRRLLRRPTSALHAWTHAAVAAAGVCACACACRRERERVRVKGCVREKEKPRGGWLPLIAGRRCDVLCVAGTQHVRPHAITVDHQDDVWLVDDVANAVTKCDRFGVLSHVRPMTICPTGVLTGQEEMAEAAGVRFPAPPRQSGETFITPTDLAVHRRTGDVHVTDGCGDSVVHRLDPGGARARTLCGIASWRLTPTPCDRVPTPVARSPSRCSGNGPGAMHTARVRRCCATLHGVGVRGRATHSVRVAAR